MSVKRIGSVAFALALIVTTSRAATSFIFGPELVAGAAGGDRDQAWQLQALSVARDLNLPDDEASRLAETHAALMQAYESDAAKIREEHEANILERYLALIKRNGERKTSLQTRASAFLPDDRLTSAVAVLGAYNDQWTTMVMTLCAFELPEKDLTQGLTWINQCVADTDRQRIEAMESEDWGAVLRAVLQNKQELDEKLAAVLTKDQQEIWKEETRLRMGGGRIRGHLPMPKEPYTLPEDHVLKLLSLEVDPVYKDMLYLRDNGWLGSDVGHSIVLSDDKSLWLFGDTFIGDLKDGVRVAGAPMINNTIGIQDRTKNPPDCMTFYWKTENGRPASFFPHQEGTPGAYYWPSAGMVLNGELFVYCWCVGGNAQGTGGWGGFGYALIRIPNPLDPPDQWIQKAYTLDIPNGYSFHSAIFVKEPYVYLYGIVERRQMAVARVKIDDLLKGGLAESYEYYVEGPDGPHWGKEPVDCVPQFGPTNTECTVAYEPEWDLYTCYTYNAGTPEIYLTTAPELTGPWSDPAPIYWIPEHHTLSFGIISYAVRQHPELSTKPGEVILTYATNAPGSIANHFTEEGKDLYYPRFIRLQLERNKSHAGK